MVLWMEECGICGGVAVGEGVVEGAKLPLCNKCLRFGRKIKVYYDDELSERPQQSMPTPRKELALVDGFSKVISAAREARKLTRKELAEKLFVRENELAAFEEGRLKPVVAVAKKLEFALGVKLLEEESVLESIARESKAPRGSDFSFGDMVTIKKK